MSILSLSFIGVIDYLTGAELSFSIFYLLPILSITWFLNKTWGIVLRCIQIFSSPTGTALSDFRFS